VQAIDNSQKSTHVNSLNYQAEYGQHTAPVAPKQKSQQAANGDLPWQDPIWRARLTNCAKKITWLLQAYPDLRADLKSQVGDWILANVHYNRPLLIAADHLASIQCHQSGVVRDVKKTVLLEQIAYANTYQEKTIIYWGDTVTQHLRRVEKVTRKLKILLQNTDQFRHALLPATSLARTPIEATSPYYWQQLLAHAAQQNLDHRPVFAAILAETGSGKTLAGVRLLDAISPRNEHGEPQLRYTLALGLRALTRQSGTALRDQALISEKDFATLVGGLVLNVNQKPIVDTFDSYQGSENAKQDEADGYIEGGLSKEKLNPDDMLWLDCLNATMTGDKTVKRDRQAMFKVVYDWLGDRGLHLLDTPIVACTVDHIVPATHATSGGDARMALRIFTSDLVLDEIDNYSAQDLITLGKLCFMVGLAGRHVVLMSATMSPFVVQGLFDAWWRGLKLKAKMDAPGFNVLTPPNINARLIFASNQQDAEVQCHDVQTRESFNLKDFYVDYVNKVCLSIRAANERRRKIDILELIQLSQAIDKTNHLKDHVYPEILKGCYRLHKDNAQPVNDIKVSVGFIRFNTAKQAWRYSKWLLQRDSTNDVCTYRVVCYHAKHPRLVLGLMDEKLNQLNNRKNSNWQNLPELQTALTAAKAAGKQDLIIIVVTTTLQETGRDHDYDWAILEPRSVRGEIQAAGRVRRHRKGWHEHINILIMSQPIRAFDPRYDAEKYKDHRLKDFLLWGRPGIESKRMPVCKPIFNGRNSPLQGYLNNLDIPYQKGCDDKIDLATEALPISLWQEQGFDSKLCLLTPSEKNYSYDDNPIGTLEHVDYYVRLNRQHDNSPEANVIGQSLNTYLSNVPQTSDLALALTRKQYNFNRFRESMSGAITIYCCLNLNDLFRNFYQRDKFNRPATTDKVKPIELTESALEKVFFRKLEENVRAHFPQPNYEPQDALFCELDDFGGNSTYNYHWALGYCLRSDIT
jgi:CRISPR-associated endonuclease/helicase Cas3